MARATIEGRAVYGCFVSGGSKESCGIRNVQEITLLATGAPHLQDLAPARQPPAYIPKELLAKAWAVHREQPRYGSLQAKGPAVRCTQLLRHSLVGPVRRSWPSRSCYRYRACMPGPVNRRARSKHHDGARAACADPLEQFQRRNNGPSKVLLWSGDRWPHGAATGKVDDTVHSTCSVRQKGEVLASYVPVQPSSDPRGLALVIGPRSMAKPEHLNTLTAKMRREVTPDETTRARNQRCLHCCSIYPTVKVPTSDRPPLAGDTFERRRPVRRTRRACDLSRRRR